MKKILKWVATLAILTVCGGIVFVTMQYVMLTERAAPAIETVESATIELETAPAQATAIAETVVAAASTVQAVGETILTPIGTASPAPTVDLTTVCIPPIGWEMLTELSLPDNLKVSAMNDWLILSDSEDKMKASAVATETKSTPFVEQGVNIEFVYTCGAVYINPDSK